MDLPASKKFSNPKRALFQLENWENIGRSAGGHLIPYKYLPGKNPKNNTILLIGGVHGNETEGVQFTYDFCNEFALRNNETKFDPNIIILPVMNPDGFLSYQRKNYNGVDLNRNMPTKDWRGDYKEEKYYPGEIPESEPETKALISLIHKYKPVYIISFHSWKPTINYNGPAKKYAEKIAEKLPMEITDDIGYPTPGSLGTWAGSERKIPTITLEFKRGTELNKIYSMSRDSILSSFDLVS